MKIYDEIRNLKAESKFKEAWQKGYNELEKEPTNVYLKTSLFWVVYAALKKFIEPIKTRQNKTPLPKEIETINSWFEKIYLLNLTLPNENIDYRLWNLFKGDKNFEGVGKFSKTYCQFILENYQWLFSDEDYKPYITEKGESPSTLSRLARTVAANVLMGGSEVVMPLDKVIAFLDYAILKANDSQKNKIWLKYYQARVYTTIGELVKARATYLDVLKAKRSECWVWFGLGDTYRDEPEKAISLIAYGLNCVNDPKFAIPGLISITNKLSAQGEYVIASKTLNWLLKIYRDNGWAPKDSVIEMTANSWFDGSADPSDLDEHLKLLGEDAIGLTVEKPVYYKGIVERVHKSGKGVSVYISKVFQVPVRKNMFKNKRLMEPGSFIQIMCDTSADATEVVEVEMAEPFESEDIRFYKGKIKLLSSGIGFVDDVFIPPFLAIGITHGVEVTGVAIMSFDVKKKKNAWKALTLKG